VKDQNMPNFRGWTPNDVINEHVPDGQPLFERHTSGGRGTSVTVRPRLIVQEEVPTSAVGMTRGQRRDKGVAEIPVPVAAVVETSRHIDAAGAKRTKSKEAILIIGQTEEKKLPASLRGAYALLADKYEEAMARLAAEQHRLNPALRQREVEVRPDKLRGRLSKHHAMA